MPIGNVPVPPSHIDEEPTISVCINKSWASVLIGQIWDLRYPEAWGGTLDENRRARGEIKNLITMLMGEEGCGEMTNCCVDVAIRIRVNVTTGMIEQSSDNGASWQPQASGFRSIIVEPVPSVTSGVAATKCDAATNVAGQVDVWIDKASDGFDTAVTLIQFGELIILAIAGAVLTILSLGALTPVELAILAALSGAIYAAWGAGKAVFDAYWTTEVRTAILCAAYCHIGDDGSYTEVQFSAFWNEINSELPASPAKMLFVAFLSSVGKEGLNAMAASGISADADCEDCACGEGCAPSVFDTVFLGTIIDTGEDYVTLESVLNPGQYGSYRAAIGSGDANTCCCFYLELLTGTHVTNQAKYVPCGVTPVDEGSYIHMNLNVVVDGNTAGYDLEEPFTVKITFVGCG